MTKKFFFFLKSVQKVFHKFCKGLIYRTGGGVAHVCANSLKRANLNARLRHKTRRKMRKENEQRQAMGPLLRRSSPGL